MPDGHRVESRRSGAKSAMIGWISRGEFHNSGGAICAGCSEDALLSFLRAATVFRRPSYLQPLLGVSGRRRRRGGQYPCRPRLRVDLTDAVEILRTDTDRIQISTTPPGADGIVRRIEVHAGARPTIGRCSRSPTMAKSRSTG